MKFVVGPVADFPPDSRRIMTIDGRSIGVFRVGDQFFAVLNRCPHQGGPLCDGLVLPHVQAPVPGTFVVENSRWFVECPWHGWAYDLETGESWFDPRKSRVRSYTVAVQRGSEIARELMRGPYTVETFEIGVEDDYVVLELGGVRNVPPAN